MVKTLIGFEIHEQLNTLTKLYCACPTNYRDVPPNTNICEVCTGMPGAKPHPINQDAVDAAIEIALMLECDIIKKPVYIQRKHYDYPDLPSGYQRTSLPIGKNGKLAGVGIWEVHLEEDPGKYDPTSGKVDYNRSGIPLVEIVTAPEMHSPEEARNFLRELTKVLRYTGKVRTEGGTMRMDTNISLEGGGRVEIKNINSVKGAYKALKFEITRQKNLMKKGRKVKRETRAFIETQMITRKMRVKEEAQDYRYIPDPDIPPLLTSDEKISQIKKIMQEAPHIKEKRFIEQYGVKADDAKIIASELELANAFEEVATKIEPKYAASWIRDELKRVLLYAKKSFAESGIKTRHIIELLGMIKSEEITPKTGKKVIEIMMEKPQSPRKIVEKMGWIKIKKKSIVEKAVDEAIKENPQAIRDYLGGKNEALNFVVGHVMKKTKGRADPSVVLKLLKEKI
jgi:aspartyl-tRNA(Asn)/glutamyl-tRNA(Gln) amidotransferase subunit B